MDIPPSSLHIALALAIVKSRPPDRPIKDFIADIRASTSNETSPAFINTSRYWRLEVQRLRNELDKSIGICAGLRADNYELQERLDKQAPTARGKHRIESTTETRPSKRSKTSAPAVVQHQPDQQEKQLLGLLYDIRRTQASPTIDSTTFASLLRQTAANLTSIISGHAEVNPADSAHANMLATLRAGSRVIVSLVQGYDVLELQHVSLLQMGNICHSIIAVFAEAMARLVKLCDAQRADKAPLSITSHPTSALPAGIHALTAFMGDMYACLDANRQHHTSLFEGFTFHLLKHIGQVLSVFADLTDARSSSGVHARALHLAEPLLSILQAALKQAPRSFRIPRQAAHSADVPLESRHSLTATALGRLQRTLVHAALGEDLSPFDAAASRIHEPPAPAPAPSSKRQRTNVRRQTSADKAEAWKAALWTHLGWDILAYEGSLADFIAKEA